MHIKLVIMDEHVSALGFYDFSCFAEKHSDELLVFIHDKSWSLSGQKNLILCGMIQLGFAPIIFQGH